MVTLRMADIYRADNRNSKPKRSEGRTAGKSRFYTASRLAIAVYRSDAKWFPNQTFMVANVSVSRSTDSEADEGRCPHRPSEPS